MHLINSLKKRLGLYEPKHGQPLIDALERKRHGRPTSFQPASQHANFFSFAAPLAAQSKAQLFQDLWALWHAQERTSGYFVEVGANDGVTLSNTYFLEQRGWNGIVAEPNPDLSDKLRHSRTCFVSTDAVYKESGYDLNLAISHTSELSRLSDSGIPDSHRRSIVKTTKVRSISLADLLSQANAPYEIDYLSIDTEGSEPDILEAFDFSSRNIRTITVEHNYTNARERLHNLLTEHGYTCQWPDVTLFDAWYIRST